MKQARRVFSIPPSSKALIEDGGNALSKATPIALTIAGSDSGGGAGIQADLKAFSARGAFGASVLTAITAQNTVAVTAVHAVPTDVVGAQIDAVLSDIDVDAIKIGMLFSVPLIECVVQHLQGFDGPVVLDPVMIAKSGDALLQADAVDALTQHLLPRAALITPNLPEAAKLLGEVEAETDGQMIDQARRLQKMGAQAVLLKGGHGAGAECTDILLDAAGVVHKLGAPRIATTNTHGTGCTYSSAITAGLARGLPLLDAVQEAHAYLHDAIKAADDLSIGKGHGPVHHFHEMWR